MKKILAWFQAKPFERVFGLLVCDIVWLYAVGFINHITPISSWFAFPTFILSYLSLIAIVAFTIAVFVTIKWE